MGGSLFSSSSGPSAPSEIQPLVPLQTALSKAAATTANAVPTADNEYEKLTDPSKSVPTPPVYAARLSALLKNLASAEGAVSESIKARRALLEGLNSIVESNKISLAAEEAQYAELVIRKNAIEAKKRDVEDGIMRGLSAESTPVSPFDPRLNGKSLSPGESGSAEPERPDVEELTPPPESATPTGSPGGFPITTTTTGGNATYEQHLIHNEPVPSISPLPLASTVGADLLSSLSMPPVRHYAGSPGLGGGMPKKRKLDDEAAVFGNGEDAMADLDEDVAELLRAESGGR